MNTFFISDLHLGHERIITLAKRPFKDVEEMNESLISNWNKTVGKNDHVNFLGDFCWPTETRNEDYWFSRLNGIKHLIIGNHDNYNKMTNSSHIETIEYYNDDLKFCKKRFVLCHYPIEQWNGMYRGSIHLHGHTHSHNLVSGKNRFNMSCEALNYKPIEIEEILELVK